MQSKKTRHDPTVSTGQNGGRNGAPDPEALIDAYAARRIKANGANRARPSVTDGAEAASVRGEARVTAACVREAAEVPEHFKDTDDPKETEVSQASKVPEDFKDTDDSEETEDLEDTKDTKDTQEPEDTTKMATKSATNNDAFARKVLAELGRKYSRTKFNERSAFFLAGNVKALEVQDGFSPDLLKIAFDAATEKIKPDKQFSLFIAYTSAFSRIKKPMKHNTLVTAQSNVASMGLRDLPEIPGFPLAGEPHRPMLALHIEMSRLCDGNEYHLSRRALQESARAKMNRYEVTGFNELIEKLGLIKIIDRGKSGKGQGKGAACFLCYIGNDSDEPLF